jgi:hypothetical protein
MSQVNDNLLFMMDSAESSKDSDDDDRDENEDGADTKTYEDDEEVQDVKRKEERTNFERLTLTCCVLCYIKKNTLCVVKQGKQEGPCHVPGQFSHPGS